MSRTPCAGALPGADACSTVGLAALADHGLAELRLDRLGRDAPRTPCHLEREPLDAAADRTETNRRICAGRFDKLGAHMRDIQGASDR